MNGTKIPYNINLPGLINAGYLRVIVSALPSYAGKAPAYVYIQGNPRMNTRGIVALAPTVYPNQTNVRVTFNITSKPKVPVNLTDYIEVFNQNLSSVFTVPGTPIHGFNAASPPFIVEQNMTVGPGKYIIMLINGSDNTELGAGYFVIPKYQVALNGNFTSGTFIFTITSGGKAVNNVRYSMEMNGQYPANGIVQYGIIVYKLPLGTPSVTGKVNFSVEMLGQQNSFIYYHNLLPFTVNTQYIELGLVVVMMIIMVVFVRAPARDEYYIDVPNLPENKKVDISLKAADVLAVFDKLNASYHWKHMPLSKTEMKSAIALNLKYNNIPVELTYSNIDSILDTLLVNKYIVEGDELYAPTTWIAESKHDIGYLASFKKMRIYFVTHSYIFTDIDVSEEADIVATLHGDKKYVVIYSDTSRFKNIPIYPGAITYLVFLNQGEMEDFKAKLYSTSSESAEKLKMYISADYIRLVDADNIGKYIG
jgi:hypothetical protein